MALEDILKNRESVYGIIYVSSREAEMQPRQVRVSKPLPWTNVKKPEKPWQIMVGLGKLEEG